MQDWTNAVKAGVSLAVVTAMDLLLAIAVILGLDVSVEQWSALTLALNAFVAAALGLWILLTRQNSPLRVTDEVRREEPLTAARATAGNSSHLAPPPRPR